jgi:hypothetical protein
LPVTVTTSRRKSTADAQFEAWINRAASLPYRKRREVLWHKIEPRGSRFRFVYKFRPLEHSSDASVDRMRDILVRSRFWLSSPLDFNDPFDMSAKIDVGGTITERKKRVDRLLQQQGFTWKQRQERLPVILSKPDKITEVVRTTYLKTIEQTGIYSFGGDPRSILMWSHYAANHEGFCIQFEVANDIRMLLGRAVTTRYNDRYPVVNWTTDMPAGLLAILETKHSGWKYEKETRIVVSETARQYIPFRPEALRGIIIGCRASKEALQKLRELMTERSSVGFPTPLIYRVFKHETKYKLVIKREK